MNDYRLYYFEGGQLKKMTPNRLHRHRSKESIEDAITRLKSTDRYNEAQFVVVEYYGIYDCKIIKVI